MKPDLNNEAQIWRFVDLFYQRMLADELLAPFFFKTANIDLKKHLPIIHAYWCKMLLGKQHYQRNTMAKHREINRLSAFETQHFRRWLEHFEATLDANFSGERTDKARTIASNVIKNMKAHINGLVTRPPPNHAP